MIPQQRAWILFSAGSLKLYIAEISKFNIGDDFYDLIPEFKNNFNL